MKNIKRREGIRVTSQKILLKFWVAKSSRVLSRSVGCSSLQLCGLLPTRLLCPRGFPRQEYWSGLPFLKASERMGQAEDGETKGGV